MHVCSSCSINFLCQGRTFGHIPGKCICNETFVCDFQGTIVQTVYCSSCKTPKRLFPDNKVDHSLSQQAIENTLQQLLSGLDQVKELVQQVKKEQNIRNQTELLVQISDSLQNLADENHFEQYIKNEDLY